MAVIFEPWWAPATMESESGLQKLWTNKKKLQIGFDHEVARVGMAEEA